MTTRLTIAYGMIIALILAGLIWLWFGALRRCLARRRFYRRAAIARRAAPADTPVR